MADDQGLAENQVGGMTAEKAISYCLWKLRNAWDSDEKMRRAIASCGYYLNKYVLEG